MPTRWEDWSAAAEAAYLELAARCDRVAVTGLSMGGTLTCCLAEDHPEIAGIAVVNPLVEPPTAEFLDGVRASMLDGGDRGHRRHRFGHRQGGSGRGCLPGHAAGPGALTIRGRRRWSPAGRHPLPHLLAEQPGGPRGGPDLRRSPGGSGWEGPIERVYLERSFHVATLDWDAPLVEKRVVEFVLEVLSGPGTPRS